MNPNKKNEEQITEVLMNFKIFDKKDVKIKDLNKMDIGMAQLAQTFLGEPDLLLLQKPFFNLDDQRKFVVKKNIQNYPNSIIYTSSSKELTFVKYCIFY